MTAERDLAACRSCGHSPHVAICVGVNTAPCGCTDILIPPPTAERDRLAALLRDIGVFRHGVTNYPPPEEMADRLIAAGVGFPPDCSENNPELSSGHSYHEAHLLLEVARLSDSLDVERLARALRERDVLLDPVETYFARYAAAIAAAYREDAGIVRPPR